MSRGKHLSLKEARKIGKVDQFAKEHSAKGSMKAFDRLLDAMAHGELPSSQASRTPKVKDRTLSEDASED